MSAPVSWGSRKQSSVSLLTSEAEYIALSLAVQEGKWVLRLLCEILDAAGEPGPEFKILDDNQSCLKMTKNPVNHGRAKHIDIKYHHIRDEVLQDRKHAGGHYDKRLTRTAPQDHDSGAWHTSRFALRGRIEGYGFQVTYTTHPGPIRTAVQHSFYFLRFKVITLCRMSNYEL